MAKRCPPGMHRVHRKCIPEHLSLFSGETIPFNKQNISEIKEVDDYTTYVARQVIEETIRPAGLSEDSPVREELHENMLEELQIDRKDTDWYDPAMDIVDEIIQDKIKRWQR